MNKRNALINLALCSTMHGLNHYLLIFFKPTYPEMTHYFGLVNIADITTRMTIIYASYAISNFAAGLLSRRFSLKMILFFGMLLMSISTILVAFIPPNKYNIVVLLIFLMGLGGGTYHPAANTLITSCYEGKPGHAIGMLSIGAAIGFIIAPFVGQYVGLKWLGFRKLFLISGSISLLFDLVFLTMAKDREKIENYTCEYPSAYNPLPGGRILAIAIVLICIPVTVREILGWSFYEVTPWWVKNGFSGGITIGWVQTMQYMPGIIVQPLTGKLCDRINPLYMVMFTFCLMAAGAILFACSVPIAVSLGLLVFGVGACASVVASETYMATLASPNNRSLVYGVALSVGLGLGGLIAGVSGCVVDFFGRQNVTGYRLWFISVSAGLILSTFIYPLINRLRTNRVP